MTTLTTVLIIFLSTFFAIINGHLDGTIVKYRNLAGKYRILAHNSRTAYRFVFYFFLTLLAYVGFGGGNAVLFALLFLIGGAAFYTPFNLTMNNVRGKSWNYLGNDSKIDSFLKRKFGKYGMGIAIIASYTILAGCIYLVIKFY